MTAARSLRPLDRDEVFARLVPVVTRWCTRLGAGRIDAEAAAGDVLEIILRRWDTFDPSRPAEAWAWGITVRVVQRHRRLAWWRRWVPGEVERVSRGPGGTVLAVLDRLDDETRAVLVLMDLEERTGPEVAALLGIPEGTVRSRLRSARAAFRDEAATLGLGLLDLLEDTSDA